MTYFLGVGTYFSRVSAKIFFWCFLVFFLVFFGGVFVLFWRFFLFFARSAKLFFWLFFFRGDFFFSRGREQNVKFPLCIPLATTRGVCSFALRSASSHFCRFVGRAAPRRAMRIGGEMGVLYVQQKGGSIAIRPIANHGICSHAATRTARAHTQAPETRLSAVVFGQCVRRVLCLAAASRRARCRRRASSRVLVSLRGMRDARAMSGRPPRETTTTTTMTTTKRRGRRACGAVVRRRVPSTHPLCCHTAAVGPASQRVRVCVCVYVCGCACACVCVCVCASIVCPLSTSPCG